MNNMIGIVVSILFVFVVIAISSILTKLKVLSNEGSRKFIHVGVSNWWIIAMIFFSSNIYAAIVPGLFVIVNYISYKKQVFKAMERDGSKNDLGTVYFALSLLILALITFKNIEFSYIGALGILIMGYGDGLAAVVGVKYGKHKFKVMGNEKSLEGSLTMFFFAFVVSVSLLYIFNPINVILFSLIIAIISTILEVLSTYGLDNLTVPLGTSLIYYLLILAFGVL